MSLNFGQMKGILARKRRMLSIGYSSQAIVPPLTVVKRTIVDD